MKKIRFEVIREKLGNIKIENQNDCLTDCVRTKKVPTQAFRNGKFVFIPNCDTVEEKSAFITSMF